MAKLKRKKTVKLEMIKVKLFHKREVGTYTITLGGRLLGGIRMPRDTPPIMFVDGEFEGEVPEVAIDFLGAVKDIIVRGA